MPILKDGIEYGIYHKKRGFYKNKKFSEDDLSILKQTTKRQAKKFKNKKLIPWPILSFFEETGFLPPNEKPRVGMRVDDLLNILTHNKFMDPRQRYKCTWLRDRIFTEIYPEKEICFERFIGKTTNEKLWPASHLRDLPGTIIK